MDYDTQKGDEDGFKTAQIMRNDFQDLTDRLNDDYIITKNDVAKLLVAATIQVNHVESKIENLKRAMVGYQTDLIPKLQAIFDGAKNDDDAIRLANEKFIIKDNK